jgi:hypothetical protein
MRSGLIVLILPLLGACRSVCASQEVQAMHGPASCCGGPLGRLAAPRDDGTNPVYWNGKECRQLYQRCGCNSCIGDDCDDLYPSMSECEQAHASCR